MFYLLIEKLKRTQDNQSKKLFELSKSNNIIYYDNSDNTYSHISKEPKSINTKNTSMETNPVVSTEEFFYDDPNSRWKPLPEHDLKASPCYPIIGIRSYHKYKVPFYYCKLHPDIENVYLETMEHHCKYEEPNMHKSEILRLLATSVKTQDH
jgi:hypothetical protein